MPRRSTGSASPASSPRRAKGRWRRPDLSLLRHRQPRPRLRAGHRHAGDRRPHHARGAGDPARAEGHEPRRRRRRGGRAAIRRDDQHRACRRADALRDRQPDGVQPVDRSALLIGRRQAREGRRRPKAAQTRDAVTPWLPLAGVIAAISVYAIAQGLTYPLLSFILARQGHSAGDDRSFRRDDADRLHLLRALRARRSPAASGRPRPCSAAPSSVRRSCSR